MSLNRRLALGLLLSASLGLGALPAVGREPSPQLQKADRVHPEISAPKAVLLGQRLAWRTLYREKDNRKPLGNFARCVPGCFEQAGQEQLVLAYIDEPDAPLLLDPQKPFHRLEALSSAAVLGPAWDYDGDGLDEIGSGLVKGSTGELKFLRPDGSLVGSIQMDPERIGKAEAANLSPDPGLELAAQLGDVDNDRATEQVEVFGRGGKSLGRMRGLIFPGLSLLGDVNGDGLAEFITPNTTFNNSGLQCEDFSGGHLFFQQWPLRYEPSFAWDANGDGKAEVFTALGFMDSKTGEMRYYDLPTLEWDKLNEVATLANAGVSAKATTFSYGRATAGDFNQDGVPEICCHSSGGGSAIVFFGLDGGCSYYEELGELAFQVLKLRSGDKDYLVLVMQDRVLITP